jgi:hypothetical protein
MAKYFSRFPLTYYSLSEKNFPYDIVTDLLVRFGVEKNIKNNTLIYTKYDIKDGDTPEIIASKLYDSPERHWLVMLANDIVDVEADWPLQQDALLKYIDEKYKSESIEDGISWAKGNVHSYYKIETVTIPLERYGVKKTEVEIDEDSYNDLLETIESVQLNDGNTVIIEISKYTKSYYDYENDVNEAKRNIKLFRREFVSTLESQLKEIFEERK